jgi:thymidylate synthase ThyX
LKLLADVLELDDGIRTAGSSSDYVKTFTTLSIWHAGLGRGSKANLGTIAAVEGLAFTPDEQRALAPYFSNVDRPVFALTNLPETVKGALFARYSRSAKSLRRLFLDEFLGDAAHAGTPSPAADGAGSERAGRLYARVLNEYGDDSVAQLGAAHIACEGVSNVLTKVLERGRLMAYLEQSTRYVPYTDKPQGRWKYHVPAEVERSPLADAYIGTLDLAFETYARWIPALEAHFRARYPKAAEDSDRVYRSVIRAKALDTLRGLLPAATTSNVGLFGSGQAYEALLLRMFAHPLAEVRAHADMMLAELRTVIPAFLTRVDQPERGGRWIEYLAVTREHFAAAVAPIVSTAAAPSEEVTLTEFDPDGEIKVLAAALYPASDLPDAQLLQLARRIPADRRAEILKAYAGDRTNRRHKPGRAFERTRYRFDILADYGAFRDLQRHRLLTVDWQPLGPSHGYVEPAAIEEAGALDDWRRVMHESAELHTALTAAGLVDAAAYAIVMAYRIRFYLDMNAREAMHLIELRTAPQGHPSYRRIGQQMHRAIVEVAGHTAIGEAIRFVDHSSVELERLQSERALEKKRETASRP